MATLTQGAIAEAIGTFALVFIGAGSIVMGFALWGETPFTHADLVGIALAHGLTIFVMVNAFGHISGGQFNPAVSVGLLLAKRQDGKTAATYIVAQLLGALLGALALSWISTGWADAAADVTNLGTPAVGKGVSTGAAFLVEVVLTFFLMSVIMGTIDARSQARVGGLAIGMTVALDILMGGPITGAAMNPARWFGPALVEGFWRDAWLYIVAPLVGAALAATVYAYVLEDKPSAHGGRRGG